MLIDLVPAPAPQGHTLIRGWLGAGGVFWRGPDAGFRPCAREDLAGGLSGGLAGGIEPQPQTGGFVPEHVVELLDGPGVVGRLAPGSLPARDPACRPGEDH